MSITRSAVQPRVLGIIPARSGSRGVPGKNIKLLGNKPLLQYSAESALQSKRISRLILTTDSEDIADIGRRCGVDVPFLRPQELAEDDTPMLAVVQHALRMLQSKDEPYEAVCLLQPTDPFRPPEIIDTCIQLLFEREADSVATVSPVPSEYNPHWVYFADQNGWLRISTGEPTPVTRRQDLPAALHRNGSVYVTRSDVIIQQNSLYGRRFYGYLVDSEISVNIDTAEDWQKAEALLPIFQRGKDRRL